MLHILITSCIALGLIGISMVIYAFYLIRINSKLEIIIKQKDTIIEKMEINQQELKASNNEKENVLALLREKISARDREINRLKNLRYHSITVRNKQQQVN